MKEKISKILWDFAQNKLTHGEAVGLILNFLPVFPDHPWLKQDDLDFAVELQKENKLDAVKWLSEIARPHCVTPLKTAKEILDSFR